MTTTTAEIIITTITATNNNYPFSSFAISTRISECEWEYECAGLEVPLPFANRKQMQRWADADSGAALSAFSHFSLSNDIWLIISFIFHTKSKLKSPAKTHTKAHEVIVTVVVAIGVKVGVANWRRSLSLSQRRSSALLAGHKLDGTAFAVTSLHLSFWQRRRTRPAKSRTSLTLPSLGLQQ